MRAEAGMKVRIGKMYCDIKADGVTRESDLRYVVERLSDSLVLLAKTKKQAESGDGWIHHESDIVKECGWY